MQDQQLMLAPRALAVNSAGVVLAVGTVGGPLGGRASWGYDWHRLSSRSLSGRLFDLSGQWGGTGWLG
jgi:hypothetical protein